MLKCFLRARHGARHHHASRNTSIYLLVPVPVPLPHPHSITIYSVTSAHAVCMSFFGHHSFWALSYWMDWRPLRSDPCCSSWHSGPLSCSGLSLVSGTLILPVCLPATLLSGSLFSVYSYPELPRGPASALFFSHLIYFSPGNLTLSFKLPRDTSQVSFSV